MDIYTIMTNQTIANRKKTYAGNSLTENLTEIELILRRVRLYARRRVLWLHHLWGLENNGSAQSSITQIAVASYLANHDNLADETGFYRENPEAQSLNAEIENIEQHLRNSNTYRIYKLRSVLKLSPFETDLVQACLAQSTDVQFSKIFAYLNDHAGRPYVTISTVQQLFGHSQSEAMRSFSSVTDWDIVRVTKPQPGQPEIYELRHHIAAWLSGFDEIPPDLRKYVLDVKNNKPLESWPVEEAVKFFRRPASGSYRRLIINGDNGSGRKTLAKIVLSKLGAEALFIDSSRLENPDHTQVLYFRSIGKMLDKFLVWYEPTKPVMAQLNTNPTDSPEIVISNDAAASHLMGSDNIDEKHIRIPGLTSRERKHLWEKMLPEVQMWPEDEFRMLYSQFKVTPGDIEGASRADSGNIDGIITYLNHRNHRHLDGLAEHLESNFQRDDLVVPDSLQDMLDDIYFEARQRILFWEITERRRLFPQGRGLLTLFTGPPGTGKTMAAQVLSNRLRMELYRIDLSTIVSKYVGETSKNLEKVISRAENLNVVLFFDEADALFGKRTEIHDAHDRFANTDTGFLLQAIEQYDGVAILASNKKGNIDPAFIRRVRYVLEFGKPDAELRARIWKKLSDELLREKTHDRLNPVISRISQFLDLTGAQIKNSLLAALFLSRQANGAMTPEHLFTGIERELMKDNQGLTTKQKEMILDYDSTN